MSMQPAKTSVVCMESHRQERMVWSELKFVGSLTLRRTVSPAWHFSPVLSHFQSPPLLSRPAQWKLLPPSSQPQPELQLGPIEQSCPGTSSHRSIPR